MQEQAAALEKPVRAGLMDVNMVILAALNVAATLAVYLPFLKDLDVIYR